MISIFSSFTPLIGYNNAGKSTILNAIEWLFKKKTFVL
ncbi:AAA family ATPase [Escherichia sp. E2562]